LLILRPANLRVLALKSVVVTMPLGADTEKSAITITAPERQDEDV
jgi:hypothetical protein